MTAMDWHHLLDTVLLPILLALLAVGAGSGTSLFLFRRQQRKSDEEIRKLHVETELLPMEAQDRHQLAEAGTLAQLMEVMFKTINTMRQRMDDMNQDYAKEHARADAAEERAINAEKRAAGLQTDVELADKELVKVSLSLQELKALFELCSQELKEKVSELLKLNEIVARLEAQLVTLTQRMEHNGG